MFGVDDGAKDEDEMLAILDAAYQSGTRLLCCTPHFHPGYWGHNRERSAAAYDRLTPSRCSGASASRSGGSAGGCCVSTSNPEDTRILEVTVRSDSPENAKRIVDQVCTIGAQRIEDAMGFQQVNLYEFGTTDPEPCNRTGLTTFLLAAIAAALAAYVVLLGAVRESYDYVLIDLPPLGSVIDAAVVAAKCDGAILVISDHQVHCHQAVEVVDQLKKCGSRILGVVRNNIHANGSGYYKKYYKNRYQ